MDADADIAVDRANQAGEVGSDPTDERDDGTPIDAVPETVDAPRLVQCEGVVLPTFHDPIVPEHDGGNGAQEDCIRRHEIQKAASGFQDLPRNETP